MPALGLVIGALAFVGVVVTAVPEPLVARAPVSAARQPAPSAVPPPVASAAPAPSPATATSEPRLAEFPRRGFSPRLEPAAEPAPVYE